MLDTSEFEMPLVLVLVELLSIFVDSLDPEDLAVGVDLATGEDLVAGEIVVSDEILARLVYVEVVGELLASKKEGE